jgi:hypothetical protein
LDRHFDAVLKLKRKELGVRAIARKLEMPVSSVHKLVKGEVKVMLSPVLNRKPVMVGAY